VKNDSALAKIDVIEHYGDAIPTRLSFHDSKGNVVFLDQLFHQKKPVILTLNYFECPMLCTYELNGLGDALNKTGFIPGKDLNLVTVSIDPKETPDLAAQKKKTYLDSYFKNVRDADWHFFTGKQDTIAQLAKSVGYQYYYDEKIQQFAHPAVVMVLTSEGVISRYLYGIKFNPKDLHLALLEAADGTIGTTVDRILLYCYCYDPNTNSYSLMATNVMKLGGAITVVVLVIVFGLFWTKERRKKHSNTGESVS